MRRNRKEELENHLNRGALWAVTYGDLMSYMMIFFLIMFSIGMSKARGGNTEENKKYEESLVKIQKIFGGKGSSANFERDTARSKEESMVTQLKEGLDKKNLSQYAQVVTTDKKVQLVLANAVLFDSNSADLKPQALPLLSAVAQQLATLQNPILIEGHTDDVPVHHGRYSSNWQLSMERAYSVLHYFEEHGVSPSRLAGAGYGQYRPLANNTTAEGRAKNRRIEIDLIRVE